MSSFGLGQQFVFMETNVSSLRRNTSHFASILNLVSLPSTVQLCLNFPLLVPPVLELLDLEIHMQDISMH